LGFAAAEADPLRHVWQKQRFGSNPLYFELRGELRTDLSVSDQSIDLVGTNIDPQTGGQKNQGLTGFVFKYDYASQELVGDMTLVDQNIAGVKFGGVLKMAVGDRDSISRPREPCRPPRSGR